LWAAGSPAPVAARPSRHHSRTLPSAAASGAVALADLEDRDVVDAVTQVRRHDLDEAADERWSEHGVIRGERVRDEDRAAALGGFALDRRER
jgi:hypothetical protein